MYYVYIIKSERNNNIYVGNSNNVAKRLTEHNRGDVSSTKNHTPYKLVYYEAFLDRKDAIGRERKLKHHGSVIGHLKKRLKNSLNK
ncbi:MAG: GIY-YIG nuclease family protein [Candidatus Omnitrophica bacterium]|nr:GIY-YIG nuclease family protein [Candidatus Omnitrophota bacterium]MBU1906262.1 GIY-YIG nuclease family protein [Candidatus Omnitrophota bacterium]